MRFFAAAKPACESKGPPIRRAFSLVRFPGLGGLLIVLRGVVGEAVLFEHLAVFRIDFEGDGELLHCCRKGHENPLRSGIYYGSNLEKEHFVFGAALAFEFVAFLLIFKVPRLSVEKGELLEMLLPLVFKGDGS